MQDVKVKQQVVEKVKVASNILVTVSTDPSVDELAAALGLTLLLNKMGKHATAVFSGVTPPAINFLNPEKTFEDTADSLRDFIIALDKEKADHLRYKVDGDVVKIFITPYRTTITGDDLEFSQGDYNVELVLALGVENKDHLDTALAAHGRILHDATVATVTAGTQTSKLGSIDWHDDNASSLSEMLVGLSDSLKIEKGILDEAIATAFLTGIVSATERFSNPRTSSKVMTMAAQLMAAGADQQLIAAKLQETHDLAVSEEPAANDKGEQTLEEGASAKVEKTAPVKAAKKKPADGELTIVHDEPATDLDSVALEVSQDSRDAAADAAEEALAQHVQANTPAQPELPAPVVPTPTPTPAPAAPAPVQTIASVGAQDDGMTPSIGGTLNATGAQAHADARAEQQSGKNKTILSHSSYLGDSEPTYDAPFNSTVDASSEPPSVDIFAESARAAEVTAPTATAPTIPAPSAPVTPVQSPFATPPSPFDTPIAPAVEPVEAPLPATPQGQTLADLDMAHRAPATQEPADSDSARAAVEAAFGAQPFTPANNPLEGTGAQMMGEVQPSFPTPPPLPDFSSIPPPPPPPAFDQLPPSSPEILGDIFAPEPGAQLAGAAPASAPADPGQFKIPGQ